LVTFIGNGHAQYTDKNKLINSRFWFIKIKFLKLENTAWF